MATKLKNSQKTQHSEDFQANHALIIGINDYQNGIKKLETPANDASHLAKILSEKHGYEVHLLVKNCTKDRLRTFIAEEFSSLVRENDRVLFYFAGHGIALDGEDGPEGYLVPEDADSTNRESLLSMRDLHNWLNKLNCRHMLSILDCCFAGTFRWASTRHINTTGLEVLHRERFERFIQSPAWQVITSAAYDQQALDIVAHKAIGSRGLIEESGVQHSPFALALFRALQGEADLIPKNGGDGVITATELYLYLRQQVEQGNERNARFVQTPGFWPLNKHEKGEYIFLTPGHVLNLPPAPELTEDLNPWRGLKSYNYDEEQSELFFGRDQEIKELAGKVKEQPFTAVLGASGTGKSSLVKAGLLPYLEKEINNLDQYREGENEKWLILPPLRPGATPIANLKNLLIENFAFYGEHVNLYPFNKNVEAFSELIFNWSQQNPGQKLLLVVDQLEELVTLCDEEVRERFLTILAQTIQQHPNIFRLIVTLRNDFEPQFDETASLVEVWKTARYILPPMDQADLRQVIEGPASIRILYFDPPELVDNLINEVIQTPGALPLLSFTLSEMYLQYLQSGRGNRALIQEDYEALGKVIGSLRKRANDEYDKLPDDLYRDTMYRIMLRMISLEGGEITRRQVNRTELDYPTHEENNRVDVVLNRLINARLLVTSEEDREVTYEPAHDALVSAWDQLLRWKHEAEQYLPLQRRLGQAANEWSLADVDTKNGLLWTNDPRLPQLVETLWPIGTERVGLSRRIGESRRVLFPKTSIPDDTKWLNRTEVKFVQESVRKRTHFWRRVVIITLAVILMLGGLSLFASFQANTAVAESNARATEVIVRTTAESNAIDAEATAVSEADARATSEVEANLEREVANEARVVAENAEATSVFNENQANLERDRANEQARNSRARELAALASAVWDKQPQLSILLAIEALQVNMDEGETYVPEAITILRYALNNVGGLGLSGHESWISEVAFSPDNKWFASASSLDGTIYLWDLMSSDPSNSPIVLRGHNDAVMAIAFSPDSQWLVTGGGGDLAEDPNRLIESFFHYIDSELVDLDSENDNTLRVWNLSGSNPGANPIVLEGHQERIRDILFSPDSSRIVSSSLDNTVRIWDFSSVRNGSFDEPIVVNTHESTVQAIDISPDSDWLMTADEDGTTLLWSLLEPEPETPILLDGHEGGVWAADFSQNGQWLATADTDGLVKVWDLKSPRPENTSVDLLGHEAQIFSVGFSPKDDWLATGSSDGTVRLWNLLQDDISKDVIVFPKIENGSISNIVFTPDGNYLMTTVDLFGQNLEPDGVLRVWDLTTSDLPREPIILKGFDDDISDVEISKDGSWLGAGSLDGTARLWDIQQGSEILSKDIFTANPFLLAPHDYGINSVAISSDNKLLASGGEDNLARIWQFDDIRIFPIGNHNLSYAELLGHTDVIYTLEFSPNNRWLATGSDDSNILLWDLKHDNDLSSPILLEGHDSWINVVKFSPDNHWLVTASNDGSARLWNVEQEDPSKNPIILDGHESGITSIAFNPDSHWLITGSNDSTARLWDLEAQNISEAFFELIGHTQQVVWVDISNDNNWIATGSADNSVRLWDLNLRDPSAKSIELVGHKDYVLNVTFSHDSQWLASGSADGTARLWDMGIAESPESSLIFSGHNGWILNQLFTSNNQRLITSGTDNIVRIWNIDQESANITFEDIVTGSNSNLDIDITSNDRWLVSGGQDGELFSPAYPRATLLQPDDLITLACYVVGRNFSISEWREYFPNQDYELTCDENPLHHTYLMEAQDLAREGDLDTALIMFEDAQLLDSELELNPISETNKYRAEGLVNEGIILARNIARNERVTGIEDFQSALDIFSEAKRLNPDLDYSTELMVMKSTAPYLRDNALSLVRDGEIESAIVLLDLAMSFDPEYELEGSYYGSFCWYGGIWDFASDVISYCDLSIELEPEVGNLYGSRGFVRTLLGDFEGAINDFQFAKNWWEETNPDSHWSSTFEEWINSLENGQNPIDQLTMELLR